MVLNKGDGANVQRMRRSDGDRRRPRLSRLAYCDDGVSAGLRNQDLGVHDPGVVHGSRTGRVVTSAACRTPRGRCRLMRLTWIPFGCFARCSDITKLGPVPFADRLAERAL